MCYNIICIIMGRFALQRRRKEAAAVRIMGIDPGYAIVGVGLVDYDNVRFSLVEYGAITTPAELPLETRLRQLYDDMRMLLEQYRPDAVAMEQLFFTTNRTTAIAVAEARGVLLLAAEQQGVPVFSYTPLQVKSAVVGYGKAEKEQVMEMTRRLLNLRAVPKPDDAADALAIAICHGHNGGSRLPTAALAEVRGGNRRGKKIVYKEKKACLLYTSPSPRDRTRSRMPSSA